MINVNNIFSAYKFEFFRGSLGLSEEYFRHILLRQRNEQKACSKS